MVEPISVASGWSECYKCRRNYLMASGLICPRCGYDNEATNGLYQKTTLNEVTLKEQDFLETWGKEGYMAVENEECPKCRESAGLRCVTEFSKRELKAPCHLERYKRWLRRVGRL